MATIQLTDVLFYKAGAGGVSPVVGYEDSSHRVARYTFTAPELGANHISLLFHHAGLSAGERIPVRYFIGTDPESHTNAGPDAPYTGELILGGDGVSFSAEADVVLLPGKTYYLWVFPGEDTFGWYSWQDYDDVSIMETEGAAFLLPVALGGVWRRIMLHVAIGSKLFLIALCVVKDGKWHFFGVPN